MSLIKFVGYEVTLKTRYHMLDPKIELEQLLSTQIYEALHGDIVKSILSQSSVEQGGSYWKNVMEGHSFKVEKRLMSHLHDLFYDVKDKLGFTEDIDFYITGNASVNAFAVASSKKGMPHIINVNSGLIDLMTDDELRFVVGHEIGHLMNKDTELLNLISFIFPSNTTPPLILQYKIRLWQQLSELVADRYGYMAVPDLGVCVSAFFKLASGLDLSKIDMQMDVFIEENLKHLDYFKEGQGLSDGTHPVNPVRVQSLNLFASCATDDELHEKMEEVIQILLKLRSSDLDFYTGYFIATAGLMVASADEKVTEKEVEHILSNLSSYYVFPKEFLDSVCAQDVQKLFIESVQKILELNPGMRDCLYEYMIALVLADKMFNEKEIEFLFAVGENIFGYGKKEIADKMASAIHTNFVPSFEALC